MPSLLTAAQMRAVEQAAIASAQVTGLELMERAGQGVVDAVFEEWPELAAPAPRALILCGPGNNGGDGFVIARLLKDAGWQVDVYFYGDPTKLPPDARVNYERWVHLGDLREMRDDEFDGGLPEGDQTALVVDALFGIGLSRPFVECRHLSMALNTAHSQRLRHNRGPRIVAVDVPSGLCADSGVWLGEDQPIDFANPAHLTVTFHRAKMGHYLGDGPRSCGKVKLVDIGLSSAPVPSAVQLVAPNLAVLDKGVSAHKYAHGHALILSGGVGKGGAARMAARGALRIGAGVVTLGCPASALQENAAQVTAIMLTSIKGAEGLAKALDDPRITALCLGPGLGLGETCRDLVKLALQSARATVLDADALTLIARDPSVFADLHPACVLTPHAGEFARLFPDISARLAETPTKGPAYSKVDATREAANRAGCVVVFKGADTIIADPSGRASINAAFYERATPWLATAGAGDVLAGFITGLLARGVSPFQASETAAWLHVECARVFGPGLIAEDLPEALPQVLRHILSPKR